MLSMYLPRITEPQRCRDHEREKEKERRGKRWKSGRERHESRDGRTTDRKNELQENEEPV